MSSVVAIREWPRISINDEPAFAEAARLEALESVLKARNAA